MSAHNNAESVSVPPAVAGLSRWVKDTEELGRYRDTMGLNYETAKEIIDFIGRLIDGRDDAPAPVEKVLPSTQAAGDVVREADA